MTNAQIYTFIRHEIQQDRQKDRQTERKLTIATSSKLIIHIIT